MMEEKENKEQQHIRIPGMVDPNENQKRINVIESKYIPNCKITESQTDDGGHQVIFELSVPDENSAKDFEIDVNEDELKLNSQK